MGIGQYILNERGEPEEVDDVFVWAKWFEDVKNRRVAHDYVGATEVSTIFLGLDHSFGDGPPVLWETMLFRGKNWCDLLQRHFRREVDGRRHCSRKEALEYHNAMVAELRRAEKMMAEN